MHQQVRTSTRKTGSGSDGPGAAVDPGGLVDILRILEEADINLRTAGGRDLDDGGVFVFAVGHGAASTDNGLERPSKAVQVLRKAGYDAHDVTVRDCYVSDTPGALRQCIEEAEAESPVYEIFVGTPEKNGKIPLQITSRADVVIDYER